MLSNILRKITSAIFLAVILVAGTIATFSPSLMVGTAQAQSYDGGMDRDRDSDRKQVSVSSLKCNNINVNVNGLELSVLPPFLGDDSITATAADGETDANSFANNEGSNSGSQINDFRFICINNNNNTVIEEQPPIVEECPESDDIEACFEEFLLPDQFELLTDALASPAGLTAEINGQDITLRSFDDICLALDGLTTFDDLLEAVSTILSTAGISVGSDVVTDIAECIEPALAL